MLISNKDKCATLRLDFASEQNVIITKECPGFPVFFLLFVAVWFEVSGCYANTQTPGLIFFLSGFVAQGFIQMYSQIHLNNGLLPS